MGSGTESRGWAWGGRWGEPAAAPHYPQSSLHLLLMMVLIARFISVTKVGNLSKLCQMSRLFLFLKNTSPPKKRRGAGRLIGTTALSLFTIQRGFNSKFQVQFEANAKDENGASITLLRNGYKTHWKSQLLISFPSLHWKNCPAILMWMRLYF